MKPQTRTTQVAVLNQSGIKGLTQLIRKAIKHIVNSEKREPKEISVLLCGDKYIQVLNRTYRNIDTATDVLSFPQNNTLTYGDVVISTETALRQAEARNINISEEVVYLALHGALHLLGYNDETDEERQLMIDKASKAAVELGYSPNGEWSSIH